jgi:serine/threonine-protein kinase
LLQGLDSDAPGPDRGSNGESLYLHVRPGSVLETISATIGVVPRVMLRDTAVGEAPSPIIRPSNGHDASTRYRIDGEIARGGMGAILKGRDPDLGRDVAIKVLREDLRDKNDLIRRFVEEAQIGGQLQHPGVVPIYEMGTFADHRPFFSMKLVKGQTLADLLATRSSPVDDLPRFLGIFAAMAQTMAYAHTRGVIHRDLKPSNVMVGSFGEVQVMDWGLAKVLARGGVVNDAKAGKEKPAETMIATARSGSDRELSHAGSILGTPSYMPPEQASGETGRIDERADVFALGSILCEILAGFPAFTGRTPGEILRKSARGDIADAFSRLDACGAEAELIALTKDCLQAEPEDRPHDANVVSDRITAYLAGVQERVQAAERERAVAEARAIEERRRRKVQLALAGSILAFTTLGGLSTAYYLQQRAERAQQRLVQAAAVDRVVGQAETLYKQAKEKPEDLSRWLVALAAVEQAEAGGDEAARPRLLAVQGLVQAGLDAARRDKALLDRLVDIRAAEEDDKDGSRTERDYSEAFRRAGIDLAVLPPAEAGARIKDRPASVAVALAGALDDWASIRRVKRKDPARAAQLSEAARVADPDPWRNDLRTALDQPDKAARRTALLAVAKEAKFDELGPISLQLLGTGLSEASDNTKGDAMIQAESVLRRAQQRHPGDVWVNYQLGMVLAKLTRDDEAIRFYTAARSIRPETAHNLAHSLVGRGNFDEAMAVFRDLIALRPGDSRHYDCMGDFLKDKGRSKEAAEVFEACVVERRRALQLNPDDAEAHANLARALVVQGKLDEVITELRTLKRLDPNHRFHWSTPYKGMNVISRRSNKATLDEVIAEFRHKIGNTLNAQGKRDEAISAYREAIRLDPAYFEAYGSLALALEKQGKPDEAIAVAREPIRLHPDSADAHANLARVLEARGERDETVAEYREAIRLDPTNVGRHGSLAIALEKQGKLDEAFAEFREAIRINPDDFGAHNNLGVALRKQGRLDEAIAEFREAIRIGTNLSKRFPSLADVHMNLGSLYMDGLKDLPSAEREFREAILIESDRPDYHYMLGNTLRNLGKLDEASAAYREAIRLKPDFAEAHCNFGKMLQRRGDYAAALELIRKGHELGTRQPGWRYPSARWVAEVEQLGATAERLPALLKGEYQPKDNAERLALAQMLYDTKRFAAAARFWAEALDADPKLGDDRQAQYRYNAACAAALAASGKGKDDPPPDEVAKTKLRQRALDWLKAELVAWAKFIDSGTPKDREMVRKTLAHWKVDTDLAGIRDEPELGKLPEAERKDWQALWHEVDALLMKAGGTSP